MAAGLCPRHVQLLVVLHNIQYLARRVGSPASDIRLDVFCLSVCGLCDRLALIELRRVMTSQQAEAESIVN